MKAFITVLILILIGASMYYVNDNKKKTKQRDSITAQISLKKQDYNTTNIKIIELNTKIQAEDNKIIQLTKDIEKREKDAVILDSKIAHFREQIYQVSREEVNKRQIDYKNFTINKETKLEQLNQVALNTIMNEINQEINNLTAKKNNQSNTSNYNNYNNRVDPLSTPSGIQDKMEKLINSYKQSEERFNEGKEEKITTYRPARYHNGAYYEGQTITKRKWDFVELDKQKKSLEAERERTQREYKILQAKLKKLEQDKFNEQNDREADLLVIDEKIAEANKQLERVKKEQQRRLNMSIQELENASFKEEKNLHEERFYAALNKNPEMLEVKKNIDLNQTGIKQAHKDMELAKETKLNLEHDRDLLTFKLAETTSEIDHLNESLKKIK